MGGADASHNEGKCSKVRCDFTVMRCPVSKWDQRAMDSQGRRCEGKMSMHATVRNGRSAVPLCCGSCCSPVVVRWLSMAAFHSSHACFPMHVPLAHWAMQHAYTPSSTPFSKCLLVGRRKRDAYRSASLVCGFALFFSPIIYLYHSGAHAEQEPGAVQ